MIPPMRYLLVLACVFALAVWPATAAAQSYGGDAAKFEHGRTLYEARQFEQAFAIIRPLAHAGHVEAQYIMGRAYEKGAGLILYDAVTSTEWLLKAAKGGSVLARKRLVEVIFFGGRESSTRPASADFVYRILVKDPNFETYAHLASREKWGIKLNYDPTTVEMRRGEILKTMWLIGLAREGSPSAKIQLWWRKLHQPVDEVGVASALWVEWIDGEMQAWTKEILFNWPKE